MTKVSLIGAGGHSRSLINILEKMNIEIKGVFDEHFQDSMSGELIDSYPLIGGFDKIDANDQLIISKGECHSLKEYSKKFKEQLYLKNIIHPKALIESSNIGDANQISPLVYFSKSAKLGSHNIIYTNSTIEHEVEIGDFNVITVNVTLCGRVKVGNSCFFGASSTVLPKLKICDNVTIGAGAVVIKDITEAGTYVGVPAKKIT